MLVLKVMHILFKKCIEKGIKKNIPLLSGIQLFCDLIACQAPLSMGFPRARILEWVAISFRLPINPHHPELCTVNILSYFPSIFTYL